MQAAPALSSSSPTRSVGRESADPDDPGFLSVSAFLSLRCAPTAAEAECRVQSWLLSQRVRRSRHLPRRRDPLALSPRPCLLLNFFTLSSRGAAPAAAAALALFVSSSLSLSHRPRRQSPARRRLQCGEVGRERAGRVLGFHLCSCRSTAATAAAATAKDSGRS